MKYTQQLHIEEFFEISAPMYYLIAGQLVTEVFHVVHDVVDAHLVRVPRARVHGVVQVVDHGAPGSQRVTWVDGQVAARLGRVKTLRKPGI